MRFAPDLAVEVLSPSTARINRGRKRDLLARHRVPEYWIADPDTRSLEVSLLRSGRYDAPMLVRTGQYESATQPGLVVSIEPLFTWLD